MARRKRDFLYTIGSARKFSKEFWQLRIDAFASVTVTCEQVLRFCVEELRIGAQKFCKFFETSVEPTLFDHGIHFGSDPFHF